MKTRSQAQLDAEQPPATTNSELERLKALFVKRPAARALRVKSRKPVRRHNRRVDELDMQRIRVMRLEHGLTFQQIGEKLHLPLMTVFLALKRFQARQNEHVDHRRHNGRHTPRKITA